MEASPKTRLSCDERAARALRGETAAEMGEGDPGGAERDRTADLVIANDALSQLSYSPQKVTRI